jgi:hypothetical protein
MCSILLDGTTTRSERRAMGADQISASTRKKREAGASSEVKPVDGLSAGRRILPEDQAQPADCHALGETRCALSRHGYNRCTVGVAGVVPVRSRCRPTHRIVLGCVTIRTIRWQHRNEVI